MKRLTENNTVLQVSLFIFLVLATSICSPVAHAVQKYRSSRQLVGSASKITKTCAVDIVKRREELHRLILSGKNEHNGTAELLEIGNISSVPALLKVLKDNPPVQANGRTRFTVTAALAVAALMKITGLNMGATYEEWSKWWGQSKTYYDAVVARPLKCSPEASSLVIRQAEKRELERQFPIRLDATRLRWLSSGVSWLLSLS